MKKIILVFAVLGLAACDDNQQRCQIIDTIGVKRHCESTNPNENDRFCLHVASETTDNLPNRINHQCFNRLSKTDQDEFFRIYNSALSYEQRKKQWIY